MLSASINTTENQICVSCPDDGMSKGCVIVLRHSQELQSTMSYEILRSEEESLQQKILRKLQQQLINGAPVVVMLYI